MTERLMRWTAPMLRFVAMQPVAAEPEFSRFFAVLERALSERALQQEPRVVRLPMRLLP